MFGLGAQEVFLLLILGVLLIGIPVGALLLVLVLVRRQGGGRVAALEAENRRLREELDRKGGHAEPGTAAR
jgi:hypothetical protein